VPPRIRLEPSSPEQDERPSKAGRTFWRRGAISATLCGPGKESHVFEIGSSLREARMRRKLELSQVEQDTRIRAKYLMALEDDRFEALPEPAYAKGFLRTYADYLGLDAQRFVTRTSRPRRSRRLRLRSGSVADDSGSTTGCSPSRSPRSWSG
jgi:hypothetical protein